MHLWTEYEGRTVAGAYTLGRLLRSEGRNGFFSTADRKGQQAIIRLTEAHYDEDEQIERWRLVANIQQRHLIEIERVGKTNFDGVPLTFALMEPEDANLGDVLRERPLTGAETLEVARAVAAALTALHAGGLVHEHVAPVNVFAVGETVKLRSDCVRECVADKEFNTPEGCADLRRRDIHDFGVLLLECLTLEREMQPGATLPDPFFRIIPGALEGTLSLETIAGILGVPKTPAEPVVPKGPAAGDVASTAAAGVPAVPPASATAPPAAPVAATQASLPLRAAEASAPPDTADRPSQLPLRFRPRNQRRTAKPELVPELPLKRWGIAAVAALIALVVLWRMLGGSSKTTSVAAAPIVNTRPAAATVTPPAATPAPVAVKPSPLVGSSAAVAPGWYVIAYTYNHQPQAQAKAEGLAAKHGVLNPHVFSPSGHAPYFVALGGPMTREDAKSVLSRARRSGMPRDTFMRNF